MTKKRKRKRWRDITTDPQFLQAEADRLLSWEYIHTGFCAAQPLRPSRIAERIGVASQTVYAIIEGAQHKLSEHADE